MTKTRNLALPLLLALVIGPAAFGGSARQTLTGIVTDDMCGRKHSMMPGKPDSDCVRACVKAGSHYALLADGKLYALKGDAGQLDRFAGKKAQVTGDLSGTSLTVGSIAEAR